MACAGALIVLALATLTSAEHEASNADLLQAAETAFTRGLAARTNSGDAKAFFQESVTSYGQLWQRGVRNPALLGNLGNAALLAGDLPRAILAYRMGLRLAPNDRVLQSHLQLARAQVDYLEQSSFARPPAEQHPPWLPRVPAGLQLLTAFVSYGVLWLALTRWWMFHSSRWLLAAGLAAALAGLLATSLFVETRWNREDAVHPVIIIADDGVLVRTGNGLSYPPRYETPLNRGVEARLLHARGAWLQIELSGGEVGWVPAGYTIRALE
ncbi:MAG TPA: hypothetical protein VGY66_16685 [Gemmataceae bacterium]|jgi:hypothetical protein|nr:hypothetical protein [Gemmataceae bacterium]